MAQSGEYPQGQGVIRLEVKGQHPFPTGVVVLAAGQARRMGRLKQLLPLGGRPLVEWTLDTAAGAGVGPVVAVLHPAVAAAGIPRRPLPGLHPVVNPWPERGQARSLRLGLRTLLQVEPALAAVLVVLADQPFIPAPVLAGLVEALRDAVAGSSTAGPGGVSGGPPPSPWPATAPVAARPVWQGQPGHPVLLGRPLFPEVLSLTGDEGARPLLRRHRDRLLHWPAPGPEVTLDLDTWADYEAACRRLGFPVPAPVAGPPSTAPTGDGPRHRSGFASHGQAPGDEREQVSKEERP